MFYFEMVCVFAATVQGLICDTLEKVTCFFFKQIKGSSQDWDVYST